MASPDLSLFTYPNETPFVELDCLAAFNALTDKEKLYAHYLSQASWYGGLIVYVQTSPEAPLIFSLIHKLVTAESVEDLKKTAIESGKATEDDVKALLVYISGILANSGNYKGFGDSKIVPNLPKERLENIILTSAAHKADPKAIETLWNACADKIYSLEHSHQHLGFGDKGTTTYFTPNCTLKDSELVGNFMKKYNLEGYNNRLFKYEDDGKTTYEVRMASVLNQQDDEPFLMKDTIYEGCTFRVTRGDYSGLLELVCQNLEKAKEYASNDLESNMLEQYIKSFRTGSLDAHKSGSTYWIKNKGPVVETYIGFIETYRDPAGMRGEFEGFVAMVNKEMSAKFGTLVAHAESLLKELPWPSTFEKDQFLKPDYTSLDVLTFSGSGIPAGINIPNYDEIRQSEGFKNVSLGNVIPTSFKGFRHQFLSEADVAMMDKFAVTAFEVNVGLHELLGHGSGKLFRKEGDQYNFDVETVINPLTNSKVTSWYEAGDTYDSKFTSLGSAYEECRAECVGLYLSLNQDVLKIFGTEGVEAENVMYTTWLNMLWAGSAKALEMYSPASKKWLQSHSQARYVILQVCLEAGEDFVKVTETEPGKNLLLSVDRSKIKTVGKKAIGDFLVKLQVYKSTGDVKSAQEMFNKYSEVSDDGAYPWARWRSIILAHKQPRQIMVQHNTKVNGNTVEISKYPATAEGFVQSWSERFSSSKVESLLESLWQKDAKYFYAEPPAKLSAAC
ncbi:dipeptidyl peptidase 3 isoform X2 [Thrips palmi]|nr:dipeptidyl peptidase 3 isoform X2 [Thrips palmi]